MPLLKPVYPPVGPALWRPTGRPVYEGGGSAAPAFVGILDQLSTSAAGAWSVARRLTADYEGNLIRLRRDSDNAESDFGYDGDGNLDTAAITTWLAGANPFVVKVYSQVGASRDMTQGTAGNQPPFNLTGLGTNSLPWIDSQSGGNLKPLTATNAAFDDIKDTGMSIHMLAAPAAAGGVFLYKGTQFSSGFSYDQVVGFDFYIRGTGGTSWAKAGLVDGNAHAYMLTYNGGVITASAKLWYDGASQSGFNNSGGGATPFVSDAGTPLRWPASGNQNDVKHCELVIFAAVLSDADALLLNQDGDTFLG